MLNGKEIEESGSRVKSLKQVSSYSSRRQPHKHGLVLDYSIGENIVLQTYYQRPFSKAGILNSKKIFEKARSLIKSYDVRTPSEYTPARALSGGNQQKSDHRPGR